MEISHVCWRWRSRPHTPSLNKVWQITQKSATHRKRKKRRLVRRRNKNCKNSLKSHWSCIEDRNAGDVIVLRFNNCCTNFLVLQTQQFFDYNTGFAILNGMQLHLCLWQTSHCQTVSLQENPQYLALPFKESVLCAKGRA